MSATKPINIEDLLLQEAEDLSQVVYNKPFHSLDAERQKGVLASAKRTLQDKGIIEPDPGTCFNWGRDVPFQKIQCWHCHEGTHPTQQC